LLAWLVAASPAAADTYFGAASPNVALTLDFKIGA